MTTRCPWVMALVMAMTPAAADAVAESLSEQPPRFCQVRTTDARINAAVERGLRQSATFRELVDRINASDVVVYVSADPNGLPPGLDGRLTFLSTIGGFRYVVVSINSRLPSPRLISMLGHELQHAREIADTDAIADSASLAREYAARLGYHNRAAREDGDTFDSHAAIRAGEQVLREVLSAE